MRKIISVLLAFLMVMPVAFAAEVTELSAGVTPDSPLYGLDVWFDNIRVGMASKQVEKARIRLEIAEERAAEMQKMSEQNKEQARVRAQEEHKKQIQEMEKAQEGLTDAEKNSIQERFQKHIMNLERVREQVPESAKASITQAIQNSEMAFERLQNKISIENRQSENEIKAKIEQGGVSVKEPVNGKQSMR